MDASQAITRRSASSLAFAFVVLGKPRRLAMNALYAFCREVDDVADEETIPIAERRAALAEWRADIQRACEGGQAYKPVIRELQPVIEKYALKPEHFNELLLGIESDLDTDRCE